MTEFQFCFTMCLARLDPWFSLELPQKCKNRFCHQNNKEVSPVHSTRALTLPWKSVIQVSYGKHFHFWSSSASDEQIIYLHYSIFCFWWTNIQQRIEACKLLDANCCQRRKFRTIDPKTVRQDPTAHTGFVSRNGVATVLFTGWAIENS